MKAPGDDAGPAVATGRRHEKPTLLMGIGLAPSLGLEAREVTATGEIDGEAELLARGTAGAAQAPTSAINAKLTHLMSMQRDQRAPSY